MQSWMCSRQGSCWGCAGLRGRKAGWQAVGTLGWSCGLPILLCGHEDWGDLGIWREIYFPSSEDHASSFLLTRGMKAADLGKMPRAQSWREQENNISSSLAYPCKNSLPEKKRLSSHFLQHPGTAACREMGARG